MEKEISIQVNGEVHLSDKNSRRIDKSKNNEKNLNNESVAVSGLLKNNALYMQSLAATNKVKKTLLVDKVMGINIDDKYTKAIVETIGNFNKQYWFSDDISTRQILKKLDKDNKEIFKKFVQDPNVPDILKHSANMMLREQITNMKLASLSKDDFEKMESYLIPISIEESNELFIQKSKNYYSAQEIKQKAISIGTKAGAGVVGIGLGIASNVGTFTGNQALQNTINNTLNAVGKGALLIYNPAIGTANLALSTAMTAISMLDKIQNDEETARLKTERLGLVI